MEVTSLIDGKKYLFPPLNDQVTVPVAARQVDYSGKIISTLLDIVTTNNTVTANNNGIITREELVDRLSVLQLAIELSIDPTMIKMISCNLFDHYDPRVYYLFYRECNDKKRRGLWEQIFLSFPYQYVPYQLVSDKIFQTLWADSHRVVTSQQILPSTNCLDIYLLSTTYSLPSVTYSPSATHSPSASYPSFATYSPSTSYPPSEEEEIDRHFKRLEDLSKEKTLLLTRNRVIEGPIDELSTITYDNQLLFEGRFTNNLFTYKFAEEVKQTQQQEQREYYHRQSTFKEYTIIPSYNFFFYPTTNNNNSRNSNNSNNHANRNSVQHILEDDLSIRTLIRYFDLASSLSRDDPITNNTVISNTVTGKRMSVWHTSKWSYELDGLCEEFSVTDQQGGNNTLLVGLQQLLGLNYRYQPVTEKDEQITLLSFSIYQNGQVIYESPLILNR